MRAARHLCSCAHSSWDDLNRKTVGSRHGPRSASGCSGGGCVEHVRAPGASQERVYETRWLGVTCAMTPLWSCQSLNKCTTVLWRVAANRHCCARGAVANRALVQRPQERRSPASTSPSERAGATDAWSTHCLECKERDARDTSSAHGVARGCRAGPAWAELLGGAGRRAGPGALASAARATGLERLLRGACLPASPTALSCHPCSQPRRPTSDPWSYYRQNAFAGCSGLLQLMKLSTASGDRREDAESSTFNRSASGWLCMYAHA